MPVLRIRLSKFLSGKILDGSRSAIAPDHCSLSYSQQRNGLRTSECRTSTGFSNRASRYRTQAWAEPSAGGTDCGRDPKMPDPSCRPMKYVIRMEKGRNP